MLPEMLDYAALVRGDDLTAQVAKAFGEGGLGLLIVRGVPEFAAMRARLLPLAHRFATLPDAIKDKYVHAQSSYSFGWSHGKEILVPGRFDEFKGSYYANPQFDAPGDDYPNIWPDADCPELSVAFKTLGQRMVEVGGLLAAVCDRFAARAWAGRYADGLLTRTIAESRTCKARLLYYFPIDEDTTPRTRDSWCGWHEDHGSLTALCPAMYIRLEEPHGARATYDVPNPDPHAGLYVRTRGGDEVKVNIPPDAIAFQIGQSSQVQTGGLLRATPHAVQAIAHPESRGLARATFAVFMQPDNQVLLDPPSGEVGVAHYVPGMRFADFARASFARYYGYQ